MESSVGMRRATDRGDLIEADLDVKIVYRGYNIAKQPEDGLFRSVRANLLPPLVSLI